MSIRLATGGRLVDRTRPVSFKFNRRAVKGFRGDTIASALIANDSRLIGRSFKYHRRRGIIASGPEEPNGLVSVGRGNRLEPNQRATTTEIFDGMTVSSQNHWPTLHFDMGATANLASKLLPAGFYYKTFMQPRGAWEHLFEPLIRRAAGLGQAPKHRDPDRYEHFYAHVDVLIVGGGIAGVMCAKALIGTGLKVLLLEQGAALGGRTVVDTLELGEVSSERWFQNASEEISASDNVKVRPRTTVTGAYDHGYMVANEAVPHDNSRASELRHRLWRIRAKKIILASGAIERPLCFAGNDKPGIYLASAVRDYLVNYGVSPGDRTVLVTNNDDAYRTALQLSRIGLTVPAILDARAEIEGTLVAQARNAGIRVERNKAVAGVLGSHQVKGVAVCSQAGEGTPTERLECEAIAVSGGWSPAVHLWSHCGGKVKWDEERILFRPEGNSPPIGSDGVQNMYPVGSANGIMRLDEIPADVERTINVLAESFGEGTAVKLSDSELESEQEARTVPVWLMPQGMSLAGRSKTWVDFQNDVKVSDIELAVLEGYESAEHAKRYTTLGMANDQGKTSNINGLAILSQSLGVPMGSRVTTTFRPPYTPIAMGAIAGQAREHLFKPTRKTAVDSWHDKRGAYWEPVGDWRRPYCFPLQDESIEEAVSRECLRVRTTVGLVDASTLGKLLVKGPDAGMFLDMLYTNNISALRPGRCRYGLMCNEDGFLMDDGVVARIDEDTYLCHTTTGGADHIHGWMEEWLQTEWWDWQVYVANITEQFSQIGIAGPDARRLLEKLSDVQLDPNDFPFMHWRNGTVAEIPARIFRISFSGELSYEVAVPAGRGLELWKVLFEAGEEFEIEPYGTEALHVLRAEKGYIMIGDETDGTVLPQDLGLDWAVSKKKNDFLGKRGQQRSFLTDSDRWKLVGLETLDYKRPLPNGAHAISGEITQTGHRRKIGRVTSSYYSPTLNRAIAMGLVEQGPERMGETIEFMDGKEKVKARIVNPVFYDREGSQIHA